MIISENIKCIVRMISIIIISENIKRIILMASIVIIFYMRT